MSDEPVRTVVRASGTHWECLECSASGQLTSGYDALGAMIAHREQFHAAPTKDELGR